MFDASRSAAGTSALGLLDAALDELADLELSTLTSDELLEFAQELEARRNRIPTVDHRVVAEIGSRGSASEHGCKSTAVLLRQLLRISPHEARERVRAATDMGPRRGLTGEVLPPIFGRVAAAQAAGTISSAHARIITETIDALPAAVQAEHDASVEAVLVEKAAEFDPSVLAQIAHRISDTLNPDGTEPTERDRVRRRELRIRHRVDGSAHLDGELTAICAEALLTVLEGLGKPKPAEDGSKDPRTAGQRNHDALAIPPNRRDIGYTDLGLLIFFLPCPRQLPVCAARSWCQGWPKATRRAWP